MNKKTHEAGEANVFQDIGLPNAEEYLLKAQLVFKIDQIMKKRRMQQINAAALFGILETDVSKILRSFRISPSKDSSVSS